LSITFYKENQKMSQPTKQEAPVQITCRIDADLYAMLFEIAKRERRSLSAQVALIVENYLIELAKSEG